MINYMTALSKKENLHRIVYISIKSYVYLVAITKLSFHVIFSSYF